MDEHTQSPWRRPLRVIAIHLHTVIRKMSHAFGLFCSDRIRAVVDFQLPETEWLNRSIEKNTAITTTLKSQ
jgi:hypothetical protein